MTAGSAGAPPETIPRPGAVPRRLSTERLLLRAWRPADFEPFAAFYADEESARFVGGPCGREEAWRRFAVEVGHWPIRGYGMYAVEERASGRFAGFVGLWRPEGWPELELGWCLVAEARGRGYAVEAALACRAMARAALGRERLVSYIAPDNAASKRVAARLGARSEATIDLVGAPAEVFVHPPPADAKDRLRPAAPLF